MVRAQKNVPYLGSPIHGVICPPTPSGYSQTNYGRISLVLFGCYHCLACCQMLQKLCGITVVFWFDGSLSGWKERPFKTRYPPLTNGP